MQIGDNVSFYHFSLCQPSFLTQCEIICSNSNCYHMNFDVRYLAQKVNAAAHFCLSPCFTGTQKGLRIGSYSALIIIFLIATDVRYQFQFFFIYYIYEYRTLQHDRVSIVEHRTYKISHFGRLLQKDLKKTNESVFSHLSNSLSNWYFLGIPCTWECGSNYHVIMDCVLPYSPNHI